MNTTWIDDVLRDVAELPDRDSPPDWSDAMLVTAAELKQIIVARADASLQQSAQDVPQPEAVHFGLIDPEYARIFTKSRVIAWMHGYSCSAQGSFTRDLDLLLVPWTETAKKNADHVVAHLADVCGLRIDGAPSEKPHGRKSWTLLLPGFGECRWVDLSVFPPV
jgi:hypothetical protein